MRSLHQMLVVTVLCAGWAAAQTTPVGDAAPEEAKTASWDFNLNVSGYLVPHDQSYASSV